MKVLVFGRTGQLSQELQREHSGAELLVAGSQEVDFRDPETCVSFLEATDVDAVINAAAYTAVDQAESEEEVALRVNGHTPAALARVAAVREIPFVHVSTDYVFDGSGDQPWSVDAPTSPLGAYGRTKLAGEEGVRAAGGTYAILRTSWVVSAHGKNFVKTMLRLGAERESLSIVGDQVGGPTPAAELATACLSIAAALRDSPSKSGVYHFSGTPPVSWADFARTIFSQAGLTCSVTDIPSVAYPTPARRPLNSRLDTSLTEAIFGLRAPSWETGLQAIIKELEMASR